MPASRSSMRARTLSLATIWLTEKCLPMSRRKSRKLTCLPSKWRCPPAARDLCFVSKSSSFGAVAPSRWRCCASRISRVSNCRSCGLAAGIADGTGRAAGHGDGMMAEQLKPAQRQQRHEIADVQAVGRRVEAAVKRDRARRCFLCPVPPCRCNRRRGRAICSSSRMLTREDYKCNGGLENRNSRKRRRVANKNESFAFFALFRGEIKLQQLWTLDFGLWTLTFARVTNAEIVRRDGRRHARQPRARHGARNGLCAVHGRRLGGGRVPVRVHDSQPVPAAAWRRRVDGGVHPDFQGKGKNARRKRNVARGQRRHFRPGHRGQRRHGAGHARPFRSRWPCINFDGKAPN